MKVREVGEQLSERTHQHVETLRVTNETDEQQAIRIAGLPGTRGNEDPLIHHVWDDVDWNDIAESPHECCHGEPRSRLLRA